MILLLSGKRHNKDSGKVRSPEHETEHHLQSSSLLSTCIGSTKPVSPHHGAHQKQAKMTSKQYLWSLNMNLCSPKLPLLHTARYGTDTAATGPSSGSGRPRWHRPWHGYLTHSYRLSNPGPALPLPPPSSPPASGINGARSVFCCCLNQAPYTFMRQKTGRGYRSQRAAPSGGRSPAALPAQPRAQAPAPGGI